jgi:hypothetical protein
LIQGGVGRAWRAAGWKGDKYPIVAGETEGGRCCDEGGVVRVMFAAVTSSPGSYGGWRPAMWCGPAQLISQQLLTNGDINKQSATWWITIVGRGDGGEGGNRRSGVEWGSEGG